MYEGREDSYLDQSYEERFEMFEPTPDQELDWAIHNDHAGDWDDEREYYADDLQDFSDSEAFDDMIAEREEMYGSDYGDNFNDGEFW